MDAMIGDQTATSTYDAVGNRESVENPNLGATVTAGDGTASVKFKYNVHGELTERTDARGATHYGYDKLGRRTCAADRHGTATWEYDPANGTGLLKRRDYDGDTVLTSASSCTFGSDFGEMYTYNADARLATVTTAIIDDATATTTLTRSHAYDDYGRPASTTYPAAADAVTVVHEYNEYGYPWKLKHGETVSWWRCPRGRPTASRRQRATATACGRVGTTTSWGGCPTSTRFGAGRRSRTTPTPGAATARSRGARPARGAGSGVSISTTTI